MTLGRQLAAEAIGTAMLLAIVVGSGIMGERLADGNVAVALLANAIATGLGLFVLIEVFGPVSGAHFNPAITLAAVRLRALSGGLALPYMVAQATGAIVGTLLAHAMFDLPLLQVSMHAREGGGQFVSEVVATFGLVLTVITLARVRPALLAAAVGSYIVAAYWFTASTSFANPAMTLARALTNTFAGIRPRDVLIFVPAQVVGASAAIIIHRLILPVSHTERAVRMGSSPSVPRHRISDGEDLIALGLSFPRPIGFAITERLPRICFSPPESGPARCRGG